MYKRNGVFFFFLLVTALCQAQQQRVMTGNNMAINATVFLPENFLEQPAKAYPVLVYLPGADRHPFYSLSMSGEPGAASDSSDYIRIYLQNNPMPGELDKRPAMSDRTPGLLDKIPGTLDKMPGSLDKTPGTLDGMHGSLDKKHNDQRSPIEDGGCLDLSMYGEAAYLVE